MLIRPTPKLARKSRSSSRRKKWLRNLRLSFGQNAILDAELAHIQRTLLCAPVPSRKLSDKDLIAMRKNCFGVKASIPQNLTLFVEIYVACGAPCLVVPCQKHMSKNARSSGSENSLGYSHTSFKQHATFSKEFAHIQCTLLCGPMPKPSLRHEELSLVRKNGFGVKSCIPPNHESSEKRCLAFGAPSLVGPGGKHFLNSGGPSDCDKISGYSCVLFKQRAFLI